MRSFKIILSFFLFSFLLSNSLLAVGFTYYSKSGQSNPTLLSNWSLTTDGLGNSPTSFDSVGNVFVIQNGHTMSLPVGPAWIISGTNSELRIDGKLILNSSSSVTVERCQIFIGDSLAINSGASFTVNNGNTVGYDLIVQGKLVNYGTLNYGVSATGEVQTDGKYYHRVDGGTIPAFTWTGNALCVVDNITNSTTLFGLNQNFGSLYYDCVTQSSNVTINSAPISLTNFTINSTGTTGSLTLGVNISPAGDLIVNTGILDLSTFTINRAAFGGTISLGTGAKLRIAGTNSFPLDYSIQILNTSSTVEYYGTGSQIIAAKKYGNINISGTRGTNNITFASFDTILIAGTFSPTATFSGGAYVTSNSVLRFNGLNPQTLSALPDGTPFHSLVIDKVSNVLTLSSNITLTGNLDLMNGTLNDSGNTITVNGHIHGSLGQHSSTASGKILLSGGAAQHQIGDVDLGRVELNDVNGATITASPAIKDLILTSGILNLGSGLYILSGGSITKSSGNISATGNIYFNGSGTVSGGITFDLVRVAGAVDLGVGSIVNGTLQIDSGGSVINNAPSYGVTSLLKYNTTGIFARGLEWSSMSGAGYPFHVQISNNTEVNLGANGGTAIERKIAGNLTIDSASTLRMNQAGFIMTQPLTVLGNLTLNGALIQSSLAGNDFYLGGNWLQGGASSGFFSSGRTVHFIGSGNQTISRANFYSVDFSSLTINKPTGALIIDSVLATSLTIDDTLSLISGDINLKDRYINFQFSASPLIVTNVPHTIFGSAGSEFQFNATKTVNSIGGGTLSFNNNVLVTVNGSDVHFGSGITTINGVLKIIGGTIAAGGAPVYSPSSTLRYEIDGLYNRGPEWSSLSGAGYPNHVMVSGSTVLNLGFGGNGVARQLAGDLTVESGSELTMNNAESQMTASLSVTGNVLIDGTLTLSSFSGGDLFLGGNWTLNGTFTPNGRLVTFNGSSQNISGPTTFDVMTLNNGTIVNLNNDIHISKGLNFANGKISTGINAVIIVDTASVSRTNGHVIGNLKKYFPGGANISKFFEIGDSNFYTPVNITLANVSIAGYLGASTSIAGPDLTGSSFNFSKNVNRFWKLTNIETVFDTCNATFTFNTADIDSGANTNNFVVKRNQAASWSNTVTGTKNSTSTQAIGLTALGEFAVGELVGFAIATNSFGSGGIAPNNPSLSQGSNQTFNFNPNINYHVDSVVVDGNNIGAVITYNLNNVDSVHTINAYFSINQYAITSSVVGNGTIAPIGSINISHGTNQSYTILPNLGYHIDSIRVDSTNVGIGKSFTFNTVTGVHSITAYISPNIQLYSEYSADVSTGLLLHFNELSGSTLADYSSNVNNAVSFGTVPANGKLGNARGLSGLSTYINVPHDNTINFSTGDFTIEAWIKTDTIYAARTQYIFDKRANSSTPGYALTIQPGGAISMATWSPTQKSIGSDVKIKSGKSYHVAGVRKNDTLRIYVNGIAGSQFLPITGDNLNNIGDLKIGARNDTNSTFNFSGMIDEVRISSIARSSNEFNVQPTPVNLASSAVSQTESSLNWVNGNGAVGRRKNFIYRGNSSQSLALIDSTDASTYSQSGLTVGTPYIYGVSTVDSTGYEGITNTVGFFSAIPLTGEYAADANTVLLLHMNEPAGSDAHDASRKGNYGVAKGSTIVPGKLSNARKFNGTSEFIEVSHRTNLNTGSSNFTVEAWVNLDTLNKRHYIVQKRSGSGFIFLVDTTNSLRFYALDQIGNTYGVSNGSIILNSGTWYHVAGVRTGDVLSIYVNGKFDQSATIPSNMNLDNSGSLTVGTYFNFDPTRLLKGSIDEVRLSTINRTPNEFNLQLTPNFISASASGTTINLAWTNGGGSAPFMRYRIYRGSDSTTMSLIDSTINTNYTNSGLTNASTYFYRISTVDSTGFESEKSFAQYDTALDTTPPAVPQNLVASAGDQQVIISWKPNNEADFQKYYVYRGTSPNPTIIIDSIINIVDTLKTYGGLVNYQQYYFRVTAKDVYGNISGYSNEVLATPIDQTGLSAPTVLSVIDSLQTNFTLRWNSTIGGDFRAYYIYGGLTPSPESIIDSTTSLTDTIKILTKLSIGKNYYFFVTAIDSNGNESGGSVQVNASPDASAPMLGEYAPDIYTMAYLRFNEMTGDSLYDVSGNANNGELFGTAVTNGKAGKGRNFDGVDDYVAIKNSATMQPQDITIEGWFKFASTTGTKVLISKTVGSGISESFMMKYISGNLTASIGTSSGQGPLLTAAWTPETGRWYHIAYTFDEVGDLHALYVNGKQIASGINTTSIGYDTHPILIGAEYENETLTNYFDGVVDEVRVTNRVRYAYEFSLPVPPYFLSASPAVNSINLSWVFDGGYTPLRQFYVYRGADSTTMTLHDSTQNTFYADIELPEFSTYYYRVIATDSTGFTSDSTYAAGLTVPDLTPPTAPVILSAIGGNSVIDVVWSKPSSNDIAKYIVYVDGIGLDTTFSSTDTSVTLTGITNGASYQITVCAFDNSDNISTSSNAYYATANPAMTSGYTPDANTVLLLHFDESTGSVVSDLSGNNNYASTGSSISAGRYGNGRDVISSNISISDAATMKVTEGSFTIDAWINVNDSSKDFIIFKKQSGAVGFQAKMVIDTGTIAIFVSDNLANSISFTSNKKISDGKWHHIALTFLHGSKLFTLYIDGVSDVATSAAALSGSFDSNNPLQIGPDAMLVESGINSKRFSKLKKIRFAEIDMMATEVSRTVVDEFRVSTTVRTPSEFSLLLPPSSLSATAQSSTSIGLTWLSGGGTAPFMRYYIYRGSDSTLMNLIDSVVNATYQNTGLTSNTEYFYRISAVDSTGFEGEKSFAKGVTTLTSYAVSASVVGNGAISPSGTITILQGTNQLFVVTADPYHHADSILVDGIKVDSLLSYTFINVATTHTIAAYFSPNVLHHFKIEASGGGPIIDPTAGQTFNITTTAVDTFGNAVSTFTGNVWFSSSDTTISLLGGLYSVPFTAGQHGPQNVTMFTSGYHTISVIDSVSGKIGISDSFFVHPGDLNHFTVKDTFGLDIPTQIQNIPFNIRITAFDNFSNIKTDFVRAVLISVPGATVTTGSGPTSNFVNGILNSHQLELSSSGSFSVLVNDSVSETTNSSNSFTVLPDTYNITSTAFSGLFSPSGVQSVSYGDTIVFTFTPNFKHHFDSLYVDGLRVMDSTSRYTFVDVISAHTINAYFSPTLNVPPFFTTVLSDTAIARFDTLQYAYAANDPDSGVLHYAIVSAPSGVSIDSVTGALKYIPITSAKGQYTIVLKVFDDSLAAVNDTVLVRVNIYGDVSGNGVISAFDGALVLQNTVGANIFSSLQQRVGDVTGNGSISSLDASYILQRAVGLISSFPGGLEKESRAEAVLSAFSFRILRGEKQDEYDLIISVNKPSQVFGIAMSVSYDTTIVKALKMSKTALTDSMSMAYYFPERKANLALAGVTPLNKAGDIMRFSFNLKDPNYPKNAVLFTMKKFMLNETDHTNDIGGITLNVRDLAQLPTVYKLEQNFPNPFNPSTTVNYQLPEASTVKIVVYNMLGQEVKTLVSEDQLAGYYSMVWNGTDNTNRKVSSGVYIYRIIAIGPQKKQYTEVKKMLMIK